jgi:hypothetical protein
MKRASLLIVVVAILSTVQGGAVHSEDARTLSGTWVWSQRNSTGPLEAIFTATGEGKWDVAFHFTFRDRPRMYSGTAEGSLSDGEFGGTVQNETGERTFTFRGSFDGGKFKGTHAEIEDGDAHETGTLTLGN